MSNLMSNIYIVGVGITPFGRHLDRSIDSLTGEAINAALQDAGCDKSDLQTAFYSGITQGDLQGQNMIPGQIILRKNGIHTIPIFNVENACGSGSTGFHLAVQMLKTGTCDVALAIGAEKMNIADKMKMFSIFDGAWDVTCKEESLNNLLAPAKGFEVPEGSESNRPYSVFLKIYAALCRAHMATYGTTQRQIAAVSAKNHQHSVHNPMAQFQVPYTIEEVLAAPPITYPLTMPMCAPVSDGAAAVVVCNEAGLKRLNADKSRAVKVLASITRSGSDRNISDWKNNVSHLAANQAYELAGIAPADVNVAEVHDATAMGEILQSENLGFVAEGAGGPAAERGDFTIGGRIPINPSGGLQSKGHPLGATGLGQIHELVTQLRGEAGARQVEGARIAAHENGGGMCGIEEGSVSINILEINKG